MDCSLRSRPGILRLPCWRLCSEWCATPPPASRCRGRWCGSKATPTTGALTDGEGRFEIPGVPVGPQTIRVRKPGFQDRPYASEDVGYQDDGPAHSVLVAAEMPDLDFALSPTSAIHGRVDLSTGDPAQGISLTLLKQVVRNGRAVWAQNGTTKTNGNGPTALPAFPPGSTRSLPSRLWRANRLTTRGPPRPESRATAIRASSIPRRGSFPERRASGSRPAIRPRPICC